MEEELRGIADKQKFNVDKLVDLVKENGEILEKMKVREVDILSKTIELQLCTRDLNLTSTNLG